MFKGGIQKEREIFDLATELNIIQKSGSWYSYAEKKLGQGKENAVELPSNDFICKKEMNRFYANKFCGDSQSSTLKVRKALTNCFIKYCF